MAERLVIAETVETCRKTAVVEAVERFHSSATIETFRVVALLSSLIYYR